MHRLKELWRLVTFKIVIIIFLLVIPMNIWGIITTNEVQKSIYKESQINIESVGQILMKGLDARMDAADYYLFDDLQKNTFFGTVLSEKKLPVFRHAFINLHGELYNRVNYGDNADAYFVYRSDMDQMDVAVGTKYLDYGQDIKKELYGILSKERTRCSSKWGIVQLAGQKWLYRCAYLRNCWYGGLIQVDSILDELYASIQYASLQVELGTDPKGVEENKRIHIVCKSDTEQLYLHMNVDKGDITDNIPLMNRIAGLMSIIFLCVMPLIIWFLYIYLLKPIHILNDAMNRVQQGTWNYQITDKSNSGEFENLYSNFNKMVNAQIDMSRQLVERETYSKRLELQNLQMQIRPHFLLNSFNLLYGLVTMQKTESSKQMILYLSDYFRYIFRSGKDMEIYEKELSLITNYISVVRLSHPFIAFEEEHDEKVLHVEVPPLLIHNYIENIIKHGLRPKEMTNIMLRAHYKEGWATFEIEDDGRGMDAETATAFNEGNFQSVDSQVHVGLQNSFQRIRFFYGQDSVFRIKSEIGKGTLITVKVHYEIGGEKDESADSGR